MKRKKQREKEEGSKETFQVTKPNQNNKNNPRWDGEKSKVLEY